MAAEVRIVEGSPISYQAGLLFHVEQRGRTMTAIDGSRRKSLGTGYRPPRYRRALQAHAFHVELAPTPAARAACISPPTVTVEAETPPSRQGARSRGLRLGPPIRTALP